MPQCVVIADDLTGGNAVGVLMCEHGYTACTVLELARFGAADPPDCDCLIYATDSRGVDASTAYRRVYEACGHLMSDGVKLYSKRIDSTLRGNLGSETDAMLDRLGPEWVAVAAPCYPASGRTVKNGCLLVDGVPLHQTDIARDPKAPVDTAEVAALFARGSRYQVSTIPLEAQSGGSRALAERLRACAAAGSRLITLDCVAQEDLERIAGAVVESGLKVLAVDPGPFTEALMRRICPGKPAAGKRILAVVGSVHPNTGLQIEQLLRERDVFHVFADTRELLEDGRRRQRELDRVTGAVLEHCGAWEVCAVIGDGLLPGRRIDFQPYLERLGCSLDEATGRINAGLGEIARRVFEAEPSFRGLYTCGGDVTVAVCRAFEAAGLRLLDEVMPLAAYGRLLGGPMDGVHLITKGGSQGTPEAVCCCIDYLKEKG